MNVNSVYGNGHKLLNMDKNVSSCLIVIFQSGRISSNNNNNNNIVI